jgi:hypothetical protein
MPTLEKTINSPETLVSCGKAWGLTYKASSLVTALKYLFFIDSFNLQINNFYRCCQEMN